VVATSTPIPDTVVAYGSLAADEEIDLAFEHAGQLARLDVDLGSRVAAGDVLAALDKTNLELAVRDAEAAVRQARARLGLPTHGDDDAVDPEGTPAVRQARAVLHEAELTKDRAAELVNQQLAPPASLDAAVAALAVAESRLQQALNDVRDQQAVLAQRRVEHEVAQQALRESEIPAPFDGVVAARHKAVPEFVAIGEAVLTLLRTDPLRLRLRVPERESGGVELNQRVGFTVDGVRGDFAGTVARLSPALDPGNRTLLVEVRVPNADGRLRPGLFARGALEVGAPVPRVTVPAAAVVAFAGIEKVFLADGEVARERAVRTGRRVGELVEIEDGLEVGALLVAVPGDLADGAPIRLHGGGR
jgi:RND family efflux transporter MFP subunit